MTGKLDIETRNVCIGRYVMDVPVLLARQQNSIDSGGDATFYFGRNEDFTKVDATVTAIDGGKAFESAVLARENVLRQKTHFSTGGSMFVSRENLAPGVEIIGSYQSPDLVDGLRLEVHALFDESHVVLVETAYSEEARVNVQSRLTSMLSSVRSANATAGIDRGFCVANVIFDVESDYEEAEFVYSGDLSGVPAKLHVAINTFEQGASESALIERGEANLGGLGIHPEKLRAGQRTVAGDPGDEWLGAFVENDQRLHAFYAETRTRKPTPESPKIFLSFSTGDEEASSGRPGVEDERAIALWDQLLTSIRRRSGE